MLLQNVDISTDRLTDTVLTTSLSKPHDCTELKVCLAGTGGYPGSIVGAEVMVPMGMLLMAQISEGAHCSSGGDDREEGLVERYLLAILGAMFERLKDGSQEG